MGLLSEIKDSEALVCGLSPQSQMWATFLKVVPQPPLACYQILSRILSLRHILEVNSLFLLTNRSYCYYCSHRMYITKILAAAKSLANLLSAVSPSLNIFEYLTFARIPLKGGHLSPSVDVFSLARRSKSLRRRRFKEEDPFGGSRDASPASGLTVASGPLTG